MLEACDPENLSSHKWEPFGTRLMRCSRKGCGVMVTTFWFAMMKKQKEQLF